MHQNSAFYYYSLILDFYVPFRILPYIYPVLDDLIVLRPQTRCSVTTTLLQNGFASTGRVLNSSRVHDDEAAGAAMGCIGGEPYCV